jgi:eukaryotic-like serine/threonine-protein kinase
MAASEQCLLNPGAILNEKWMILGLIGKGGMGEVYHARQMNLQRDVAIKVISREWLQADEEMSGAETSVERFRREFQTMAQVRHPNIIQIYDYGSCSVLKEDETVSVEYIAMEYIPGATLRYTMSEEGFVPDQKLIKEWLKNYFLPVLEGVQALHALGIVHRDLKPENILMDGSIPKISDFGLARTGRLKPLSGTADALGTLPYMPPEQFINFKWVDQRGDIFSLGRILFEALAGKISKDTIPFRQVRLTNPATPFLQTLDRIIQEATAEDRDQRLGSVETMRLQIGEAIKNSETDQTTAQAGASSKWVHSKWIWGGLGLTFLSVLLMTLWHLLGEPDPATLLVKLTERKGHQETRSEINGYFRIFPGPLKDLPPSIMGEDGSTLVLVQGGDLQVKPAGQSDQKKEIRIPPFYMDQNMVSNENFVAFLNEVKNKLTVGNGVVKGEGQIWFLMGMGTESYEHIIHKHDRFHLKDLQAASLPVVRVTWYGAMAYARHYHKRLPTEDEWMYAAYQATTSKQVALERKGKNPSQDQPEAAFDSSNQMSHMDYFMSTPPKEIPEKKQTSEGGASRKSLNFLQDLGGTLKEWAVRSRSNEDSAANSNLPYKSAILGRPELLTGPKIRSQLISNRYPWEGFPDVGFRCLIEVLIKK